MKKFILAVALCAAISAQAVQVVYPSVDTVGTKFLGAGLPNSWKTTVRAGQNIVFYARYVSTNKKEAGLGLRVLYDANLLQNVVIDRVVTKCLLAQPGLTPNAMVVAWMDVDLGWPGAVDTCAWPDVGPHTALPVPLNLFRFTATIAPTFTSGTTNIAITTSGTCDSWNLTSTVLVVTGAP